ncbi:Uncharacterized protein APZ42_020662 [Daphnia magna]|uniref:Uncharacterized protein n=1 Tax=Daphnia magna TaxID=35525 RepID=A0A0P5DRC3_9CRUS|nr:Uncharacterized protein APZ42_020662 [Daphnia magna]
MGDWLHSFIFAAWDNVVGPKILKKWPTSGFMCSSENTSFGDEVDEVGTEIKEERAIDSTNETSASRKTFSMQADEDSVAKYISVHTLTGHLAKTKYTDYDGVNEISLNVPALGFASQTATFYCLCFSNNYGETNNICIEEPHMVSLSMVFDYKKGLDAFWNLQPLIVHLLSKTVERLKVGLSQDLNYHEEPIVSEWLGEIHHILKDSCRLRISRSPPTSPISIKQTMFKKSQIAWDVVITSMLTTMGSCCVVGKSEEQINGAIDVLAFFLPDTHQFLCSRYAANRFSSGLFIQGLLENINGVRNINSADILLNEFPLTLLDLTQKGRIRFSGNVHEHYRCKQRHAREQEFNIIQRRQPNIPFSTESVFRPCGESSRYVRWCLEQLATHNTEHWSRIIAAFHQALALQAHDVIKAFQSKPFPNGESLKLMRSQLKKSMKIAESDFWLLVSTAERLKPGFSRIFANYRL